jgi:hypothetical protein
VVLQLLESSYHPLPPEFAELPAHAQAAVREVVTGREVLLYMPFNNFSQKRFTQVDIELSTMRWSFKDYIGLDQIHSVYIYESTDSCSDRGILGVSSRQLNTLSIGCHTDSKHTRDASAAQEMPQPGKEDSFDRDHGRHASFREHPKVLVLEYLSTDMRARYQTLHLLIFIPR